MRPGKERVKIFTSIHKIKRIPDILGNKHEKRCYLLTELYRRNRQRRTLDSFGLKKRADFSQPSKKKHRLCDALKGTAQRWL